MDSNTHVVSAQVLTKRFGDFTAVDGIDFDVPRGRIFGFLGPNGSGKTTTIRMMLGLLPPTSGSIEVLGVDVNQHPTAIRSRLGYMSQRFSLYNDLTVMENLRFNGRVYGLRNRQLTARISDAVEMAGLKGREHARTRDLAGGWRQRLALSAAILHRPELLFLDEPTAGVDPVSRRAFWDLLYNLVTEGTTVFVTTHYMDEAEHCHQLAFIQHGRIIARGSPAELRRTILDGQVLELAVDDVGRALEALRAARESGRLVLEEASMYGSLIHVVGPGIESLRPQIESELAATGVRLKGMEVIDPSLEDVFIASMQKAGR